MRVRVRIRSGRCGGIHLERHRRRERRLGFRQYQRGHQQVAAVLLYDAELAGIERRELFGGDVDPLDLAAVVEMAGDVGLGQVEGLALEDLRQPRARFPALARSFLLQALGLDAFVLFLLCAERV